MSSNEIKVRRDSQNREMEGWEKLLQLIDKAAIDEREEFHPGMEIGPEIWKNIRSLPKAISKLKKVKHLILYGSNLQRIPQEIGELESLEKFTPYTSYGLRWFPYELIHCKKLISSTVSTRALFGNKKNKKPFPNLKENPVEYFGGGNKCSICKEEESRVKFEQYWISAQVGSDVLPLLAVVCSQACYAQLASPYQGYHPRPHKGEK